MKRTLALSLGVIILIAGGTFLGFLGFLRPASCSESSTASASIIRSRLQLVQFGAVRKYKLPPGRSPNAITVGSDGSVWFGEQALPGIAHLYTNGTLVEYAWPFQYKHPSFTFIWGIADWNGCVWATDQAGGQLVAVDPNTGRVRTIQVAAGSFPYTITIAPDDTLWFTEVFAFKLARVDNQFNVHEYQIPELGEPAQIAFANNSLAYYIDAGNVGLVEPGIYAFNPNDFSPTLIDSSTNGLIVPTGLALVGDGIWVTQHATSELAYYNFGSHEIIQFPTTHVSYVNTTLPYFVAANGSLVWFNEHYANRIGVIDTTRGLLTEYSLSDPPASKTGQIDNALTFALGGSRVWFTELTANYVGYINATLKPTYSFRPSTQDVELSGGSTGTTTLTLQGTSDSSLTLITSYPRTLIPKPSAISLTLGNKEISTMQGPVMTTLTISLSLDTLPGRYELLVTATNGLTCQGVYLTLVVVE